MKCPFCRSSRIAKAGHVYTAQGKQQRYYCNNCHKHTTKPKK